MSTATVASISSGTRISQRQPTACKECSRRKVRCDKKVPCSRCIRLRKPCAREVVHTSKALAAGIDRNEEIQFLTNLDNLLASYPGAVEAQSEIRRRIAQIRPPSAPAVVDNLSITSPATPPKTEASTSSPSATSTANADDVLFTQDAVSPSKVNRPERVNTSQSQPETTIRTLESLAWGRHSGSCYPHRRGCYCIRTRKYSEMASVNCDMSSPILKWVYVQPDPSVYPPVNQAREIVRFHVNMLQWHHNAYHSFTYLEQCEIFWTSGTVVDPLWKALYLAIISTTLWTVINSNNRLEKLSFEFDESLIERQYREMVKVLHDEQFLENPSLFAIQAIVISTRLGHSIGFSALTANLLASATGVAYSLGLHKIRSVPCLDGKSRDQLPSNTLFEAVEVEVGKRTWWQLLIQDHFSIPFTQTYLISPSHYSTELPLNCDDEDLVPRDDSILTTCSYTRTVGKESRLMVPLSDGLGPLSNRRPMKDIYRHVLESDQKMRDLATNFPWFLLREPSQDTDLPALPRWLPTARRTLAISAADKIVMIHRPVLLESFRAPDFPMTRVTCIAAAMTILREHEYATSENQDTLSIWTQSAFCGTAAIVLGLELLYRRAHTDDQSSRYRHLLKKAAERLRRRRVDILATRLAQLIDVLLAAEEEIVVRVMRDYDSSSLEARQRDAADEFISSQEMLSQYFSLEQQQQRQSSAGADIGSVVLTNTNEHGYLDMLSQYDMGEFDEWFNAIFAPVYN